jgi:hypothetical protein
MCEVPWGGGVALWWCVRHVWCLVEWCARPVGGATKVACACGLRASPEVCATSGAALCCNAGDAVLSMFLGPMLQCMRLFTIVIISVIYVTHVLYCMFHLI